MTGGVLSPVGGETVLEGATRLGLFHQYIWVGVIAFVVTICTTPIMRRIAVSQGIVDRPDSRKVHRAPIAYMGGVAVYLGMLAAILFSYVAIAFPGLMNMHETTHEVGTFARMVPFSVVLGMTVIMIVGLLDDIVGVPPWQKVGGMLFAAAALAYEDVGIKVAAGVLAPIGAAFGLSDLFIEMPLPVELPLFGDAIRFDLVYWAGTAVIAVFVLGGCNAANLIDGLDGLLTGITSVAAVGLLLIALSMGVADDGPRDAQRVVLCLALLGACLGFLPHNFNPATIFLGDCGSLLLGFTTMVVILTLGDTGKTHLVFAGLFIYAVPIIDTVLAIVRRKLAGKSISAADNQHLHHMLKRSLGVRGAVFVLYGIGSACALIGVAMSLGRARVSYAIALLFASYVIVIAIKAARRVQIEEHTSRVLAGREAAARSRPARDTEKSDGSRSNGSRGVQAKAGSEASEDA